MSTWRMGTQRLFEIVGFFVNAQCHRRFQHSVICLKLHDDFSMGTIQSHPNGGRTKVTFACECPLLPRLFVPASALVFLGQLSEKKKASRPLSFDHSVPVQGSHSFPSTEKLASHRTILPCRRKKCSSLEVVVLWRSLECHDHRKSRYIKIYQDVRRIQKQLEQGLFEFHTSRSIRWIWICRDPHLRSIRTCSLGVFFP